MATTPGRWTARTGSSRSQAPSTRATSVGGASSTATLLAPARAMPRTCRRWPHRSCRRRRPARTHCLASRGGMPCTPATTSVDRAVPMDTQAADTAGRVRGRNPASTVRYTAMQTAGPQEDRAQPLTGCRDQWLATSSEEDQQQCSDGVSETDDAQRRDAVDRERALRHNRHAEEQRCDRRLHTRPRGTCGPFPEGAPGRRRERFHGGDMKPAHAVGRRSIAPPTAGGPRLLRPPGRACWPPTAGRGCTPRRREERASDKCVPSRGRRWATRSGRDGSRSTGPTGPPPRARSSPFSRDAGLDRGGARPVPPLCGPLRPGSGDGVAAARGHRDALR